MNIKEKNTLKQKKWRAAHREVALARAKAYRETHKEELNAAHRKYRAANKEKCATYIKAYNKTHAADLKKKNRMKHLKHVYNITLAEYDQMLEAQSGVCKICGGINADGRRLTVDHDHETGKIRGLLCSQCNAGLGFFKDNYFLLAVATKYLYES